MLSSSIKPWTRSTNHTVKHEQESRFEISMACPPTGSIYHKACWALIYIQSVHTIIKCLQLLKAQRTRRAPIPFQFLVVLYYTMFESDHNLKDHTASPNFYSRRTCTPHAVVVLTIIIHRIHAIAQDIHAPEAQHPAVLGWPPFWSLDPWEKPGDRQHSPEQNTNVEKKERKKEKAN